MYWGDEYIAIYNEAYIMLAGQKHPKLMGMSYSVAWAEIWVSLRQLHLLQAYTEQCELTTSRMMSRMSSRMQG